MGGDRPRPKERGFCKVIQKRLWYQQRLLAMQVLHLLRQGLLPQPRTEVPNRFESALFRDSPLRVFPMTLKSPSASFWCR